MRVRNSTFRDSVSYLLLVIGVGSCAAALSQQVDVVQQWLAATCPVGELDTVPADLSASVPGVVSALISAMQNGPDAATLAQREVDLSTEFDQVRMVLTSGGGAGLSSSDFALLQSETAGQFIGREQAAFILGYKIRALQGLAVVRSNAGLQAIQLIASSSTDPNLQKVARHALIGVADVNSDGAVNCVDVAVVRASLGKSVGQQGYDLRADINRDGVVNSEDLKLLRQLSHKELECE
jgi:Dockerin type I domain